MLKVKPLDKSAGGPANVEPGKRLWLTKDGKRLVEDGDPTAATLYCPGAGHRVPRQEYEKLVGKPKPKPKPQPKPDPQDKKDKPKAKKVSKAKAKKVSKAKE